MASQVVVQTDFKDLPLRGRGKVRDIYDLGDTLLIVATDRISAFDVVMPNPIPDKGMVLTQISRRPDDVGEKGRALARGMRGEGIPFGVRLGRVSNGGSGLRNSIAQGFGGVLQIGETRLHPGYQGGGRSP
jgi:hypothetical protein